MDFLKREVGCQPTLDVAASISNAKAPQFFDMADDGLSQNWWGEVWMNPPFGRELKLWIQKAVDEYTWNQDVAKIWILVPARTDTTWFSVLFHNAYRIWFVNKRLNHSHPETGTSRGTRSSSPFPSMLALLDVTKKRGPPIVELLHPSQKDRGFLISDRPFFASS